MPYLVLLVGVVLGFAFMGAAFTPYVLALFLLLVVVGFIAELFIPPPPSAAEQLRQNRCNALFDEWRRLLDDPDATEKEIDVAWQRYEMAYKRI